MAGESRSRQPFAISDFRPGLATEEGAGALPPGAATEALNTMPSPSGALAVRPSIRQLDNDGFGHRPDVTHSLITTNAQGLDEMVNIAVTAHGATSFLSAYGEGVRATNDQMNATGSTHGANRLWRTETGGRSLNFPLCPGAFVTLHGQTAFISNQFIGRIGMAAVSGALTSGGDVVPFMHRIVYPLETGKDITGCIAVVHHGRMFIAGNNSYPTRLRWSWVGEPVPEPDFITENWPSKFNEAWPSTNVMNIDANGSTNDPISGLASYGNVLWVFTTGAVYQVSGADWDEGTDITLQQVPGAAGCVSPRTVWSNENGIFYVSTTGPKRVDRSRFEDISAQVARSFDGRALEHSHAVLTPERYLVTLPSLDSVVTVRNAINEYDSTKTFPSWHGFPGSGIAPISMPLNLGPTTGAEGDTGNFMRWLVADAGNTTGITPNDAYFPSGITPANAPLHWFTMPFSTQVTLRFWVRRPGGIGLSWDPDSGLRIDMGWFFENDFGPDDVGIPGGMNPGVFQNTSLVIGGNTVNSWELVSFTGSFNWTNPKQPPEAMGIYFAITLFGWSVGSMVDFDKFELWPGLFTEVVDDIIIPPSPTDPIPAAADIAYDRTYAYDIASGGWSRWSLGHQVEQDQPVNYSRAKPHTQDRFNYVTGGGTGLPISGIPTWEDVVTDADPVAWWRFADDEGNPFEDSIGSFDLTAAGELTYDLGGPIGDAVAIGDLSTPGVGSHVFDPALNPAAFTVMMWVRPDNDTVNFVAVQSAGGGSAGGYSVIFDLAGAAGPDVGAILGLTLDGGGFPTYLTSGAGVAIEGTWVHVTLTNDGTTGTLYVNGLPVDTGPAVYSAGISNGFFTGYPGVPYPTGNFTMDELVLYDRVLTQAEINAHYVAPGESVDESELPELTVAGGYYTLEHRRDQGDKFYDPEFTGEGGPALLTEPTPWAWTSGALVPATVPNHELRIIDSHLNVSTVGPNPTHEEIEITSLWGGAVPDPSVTASAVPAEPVEEGFITERIRTGHLGRGSYPQVGLEGNATGEIFIHAIDLETEVDPRP